MNWALENADKIASLTWQHVWLSAIPIVLGLVLALPLGWLAHRSRRWRGVLLGGVSLLYTIPSLPLLVIVPSVLGLGFLSPVNLLVALTLYAVAILVRSVADALASLPASVLGSARALGFSSWQQTLRVELPLAGPVILAGLRVTSVSTVSLVSIGALIGVSSLGNLFTEGYRRDFTAEILVGIVLTIVVAFAFDALLVLGGRLLMPWVAADRAVGASR